MLSCIEDYEVHTDYFVISKLDGEYCLADGGNYNQYLTKCIYEENYSNNDWEKDEKPYSEEYRKIYTMLYELDPTTAEFEGSHFNSPTYTFAKSIDDNTILKSLQQTIKYKQPKTLFYTNYMVKVSLILYPKLPYNTAPILLTKTFEPKLTLYQVNQQPIFFYNSLLKPEYVSSYDLWMNRWNWVWN